MTFELQYCVPTEYLTEDKNVYVIVKNYMWDNEEVIIEVIGWEAMLSVIHPLRYEDMCNKYEAFLKEDYYDL